jgi:hypothetical protein
MLFTVTHRQDVLHYLSRELNLASMLLRVASNTPKSPMNRQLAIRLQTVGMTIRLIKDVPGDVTLDMMLNRVPVSLRDELQGIVGVHPVVATPVAIQSFV